MAVLLLPRTKRLHVGLAVLGGGSCALWGGHGGLRIKEEKQKRGAGRIAGVARGTAPLCSAGVEGARIRPSQVGIFEWSHGPGTHSPTGDVRDWNDVSTPVKRCFWAVENCPEIPVRCENANLPSYALRELYRISEHWIFASAGAPLCLDKAQVWWLIEGRAPCSFRLGVGLRSRPRFAGGRLLVKRKTQSGQIWVDNCSAKPQPTLAGQAGMANKVGLIHEGHV